MSEPALPRGRSELYMLLAVCERFGIDPLDGIDRLQASEPGWVEVLLQFERGRRTEEEASNRGAGHGRSH